MFTSPFQPADLAGFKSVFAFRNTSFSYKKSKFMGLRDQDSDDKDKID